MTRTRDYRGDETIDIRDLERRLEELSDEISGMFDDWWKEKQEEEGLEEEDKESFREEFMGLNQDEDAVKEHNQILELKDEVSDWHNRRTLIRDDHFVAYARQYAEDIGAINDEAYWPLQHIDWEAAAKELQTDYTAVEFDGTSYWYRQ